MQTSSVSHSIHPFSGLCLRLSPKCPLAANVYILKSMFQPASCPASDRDSLKWTSVVSFVLSNRMCVCMCVSCQGAHWPFNVPSTPIWEREKVFQCIHPVTLCLLFHPEWHMGTAVLLRTFQGYEPHAVYWVWHVPPGGHDRRVADHPQHDCRRDLLRHVCRPCHSADPIFGLFSTSVPGEGETSSCVILLNILIYFEETMMVL